MFIIEDEDGYSILIRLPKDENGTAYSSWTTKKVVVGDTIQVYGKPSRNTSTPSTEAAKIESGVLTVLKHEHKFSEATCTEQSTCPCLAVGAPALGHIDGNADEICDRCSFSMNLIVSNIVIATDANLANGVTTNGADGKAASWTWSNDDFDAIISKGTSTYTLYTTAKAYMQLKKLNDFKVVNKNDKKVQSITIFVTNATQLGYLKAAIGTAYEYTVDESKYSVTIELNSSTEDFYFSNVGTSTVYISGVEIVYEK